jgi:transposase
MVAQVEPHNDTGDTAMALRPHPPSSDRLFGYDPNHVVAKDHLARLIDQVVDEVIERGMSWGRGRPAYDPRMTVKILMYGYAIGLRSSRQLEQQCRENLVFLYLTRGDGPSYRTLCRVRVECRELLEAVWVSLFTVADEHGMHRLGKIVVDSTKIRANVSSDSVVEQKEYEPLLQVLDQILKEADEVDAREEQEGADTDVTVGKVEKDQMRDIVRRARGIWKRAKEGEEVSSGEKAKLTTRMRARVREAIETIEQAQAQKRKHVSLTDADARMMPEGRDGRIHLCHSFEVAVDNSLVVVGQSTHNETDNDRLPMVIEQAHKHEPQGVKAADADSGYYSGDVIAKLLIAGIDVCVPDSFTARDLREKLDVGTTRAKSTGSVAFEYDSEKDLYRCPPGNELRFEGVDQMKGQLVRVYKAVRSCEACELAHACLKVPGAKRRTLKRGAHHDLLIDHQQRFADADYQERHRNRGQAVETVFGFLRATLGYGRWFLRGASRVACEAVLFKSAYQLRKIHKVWVPGAT